MRSDHYLSVAGHSRGALDAWGTICALGPLTERIRLGTLVSPVTFRPAAVLAKLALTADHTSGGRIDLGIGTGWHQAEHDAFGLTLPPMKERFDLLEQQVADVVRFWEETLPAPVQSPRPRIILGGKAGKRAAALASTYADEYNLLFVTPEVVRREARRARRAPAAQHDDRDRRGRDPFRGRRAARAHQGPHGRRAGRLPGWSARRRRSSSRSTDSPRPAWTASCSSTCCTPTTRRWR